MPCGIRISACRPDNRERKRNPHFPHPIRIGRTPVTRFATCMILSLALGLPGRVIAPCCVLFAETSGVDIAEGRCPCCDHISPQPSQCRGHQAPDSRPPADRCPGCPQCIAAVAVMNSGPQLQRLHRLDEVAAVSPTFDEAPSSNAQFTDHSAPRVRVGPLACRLTVRLQI